MTMLVSSGVIVATVPPPHLAPGFPATYVIGSETQYGQQAAADGFFATAGRLRGVIVTRGADGVVIHDRGGSAAYPAQRVLPVDTTGAGDAFAAGFLRQIAVGSTNREAVAVGIAWASATVQSAASIPPPAGCASSASTSCPSSSTSSSMT